MQKYREILIYLIIFCRKCHYNAKSVKKDKVSCTIENKEVPLHRFSRELFTRAWEDSGCSAVGSAPGLGPGGRPFESGHPDILQ